MSLYHITLDCVGVENIQENLRRETSHSGWGLSDTVIMDVTTGYRYKKNL